MTALDGLRGIAALGVAVYHNQGSFSNTPFLECGWICVDLFFLISGIVLSHVYEARIAQGMTSFTEFLSHRISRLWPVHFFAMSVMLVLDSIRHSLGFGHMMDWHAPFYTYLLNLVFLQNIGLYNYVDPNGVTWDGHTWDGNAWSLTPEITVNFIWFYLLLRKKLSSKVLISVVLVFAILQYNLSSDLRGLILSSNLVRCTISFALGCLVYRHFIANPRFGPVHLLWSNLIGLALVSVIAWIFFSEGDDQNAQIDHWDWTLVLFIFPALAYFALQPRTVLNRVFSSLPLVFLGTISYSVYLLHYQIQTLTFLFFRYVMNVAIQPPYAGILYLLLTISLAALVCWGIENPARRFLRERLEPYLRTIFFDVY